MYKQNLKAEPLRKFDKVHQIITKHGAKQDKLIPILQEVQKEFRYLPEEMLNYIATVMELSPASVYGVATFYSQFSTEPKGKHVIQICDGTACHVRGSMNLVDTLRSVLGLEEGQTTTDDMLFTLETVSCIGACALAPAVLIDEKVYGHQTSKSIKELINKIKEEDNE